MIIVDKIREALEELVEESCAHPGHEEYYKKAEPHHRFWCCDCRTYMRGPDDTPPQDVATEALTHLDKLEQYVKALEDEAYFAFHWFAIAESKNRDNNWMLHAGSEVLTAYKQARQKRLELRKEIEGEM